MKTFVPQRLMCWEIVTLQSGLQAIKLLSPIFFCFLLIYSFFLFRPLLLTSAGPRYYLLLSLPPREYLMICRGSGFSLSYDLAPTPPSPPLPLPWAACLSFSVFLCVAGRAYLLESECLDWQPSQFINIVGKDDVAIPGNERGGDHTSCAALLPVAQASSAPASFPHFRNSTLTHPPTLG